MQDNAVSAAESVGEPNDAGGACGAREGGRALHLGI